MKTYTDIVTKTITMNDYGLYYQLECDQEWKNEDVNNNAYEIIESTAKNEKYFTIHQMVLDKIKGKILINDQHKNAIKNLIKNHTESEIVDVYNYIVKAYGNGPDSFHQTYGTLYLYSKTKPIDILINDVLTLNNKEIDKIYGEAAIFTIGAIHGTINNPWCGILKYITKYVYNKIVA